MTESDIGLIYDLCLGNGQYYEYCAKQPSTELIKDDLTVTPPGKSTSDKYYVGFFDREKLIAVLDLIDGYPEDGIAFIGFFMLAKERQGQGLGSLMVTEICDYLKSVGFTKVRLGIDKDNPQSNHFWKKNGFAVLKEVVKDDGVLLLAEKTL
ncbi:MAG: GNAT family N-acetyltransferase [Oscillospiraceae bacterium]|nr:GNAT family N-acetyltransferase [Oscillospiraceae bacterium]